MTWRMKLWWTRHPDEAAEWPGTSLEKGSWQFDFGAPHSGREMPANCNPRKISVCDCAMLLGAAQLSLTMPFDRNQDLPWECSCALRWEASAANGEHVQEVSTLFQLRRGQATPFRARFVDAFGRRHCQHGLR